MTVLTVLTAWGDSGGMPGRCRWSSRRESLPVLTAWGRQVVKTVKGFPKKLTNDEAAVIQQRMKALGGRNRPPIPAGMDPSRTPRMSRKALRGR